MTSATPTKRKMTAEEFWQLCSDGKPRELVREEVVEKMPVNLGHGSLAQWIGTRLSNYQVQMRHYIGRWLQRLVLLSVIPMEMPYPVRNNKWTFARATPSF